MSLKDEKELSINCLPNETLGKVLALLPIIAQIRLKPANKRLNALLKKSLDKEMIVSRKDFLGCDAWTHTDSKLRHLFNRYGQKIAELSMQVFNASQSTCDLFYLLSNLRHLDMGTIEITNDRLVQMADSLPNLLSLSFGWSAVKLGGSVRFRKLAFLRCKLLNVFFGPLHLPPALKYLDMDLCSGGWSLVHEIEPASQVESLSLGNGIKMLEFDTSFNFEGLKHLSICAGGRNVVHNADHLARLLRIAPNLLALELKIEKSHMNNLTEWLNAIGENGKKLQHLGVTSCHDFKEATLNLDSLISLAIYHLEDGEYTMTNFLEQVAAFGKLEFFKTNFQLSAESICKAVKLCKNLKSIGCSYDYSEDWNCLMETLDEMHGPETAPSDQEDYKQVLHMFDCQQTPIEHPWLRFHREDIKSPIAEGILYGCLSEKPKFAGDYY